MLNKSALAAAFVALGFSSSAWASEVVLRAGTFVPPHTTYGEPFQIFANHINETGKGVIQIRIVGGPEAIPATEQTNAVMSGILDIAAVPPSYYKGQMVEADAQSLTNQSVAEQRANGAIDALNAIAEERMGVKYLTGYGTGVPFHIFLNRDVSSLDDLRGMRLRGQTTYNLIFEELGIDSAAIPAPDVYTSLERGVISGYGWPLWGIQDFDWDKMTKVRVDPGFYNVIVNALINKAKFDSLSPAAQQILADGVAWFEEHMVEWSEAKTRENLEYHEEAGIQVFDAGPELLRLANEVYWADLEKLSPEIPALRTLLEQ